jgi:flagellar protein FliO/FliZ
VKSSRFQQLLLGVLAGLGSAGGVAGDADRAAAGGAQSPASLNTAADPLALTNLWQLTLAMLLVLGLILAMAWLLKRTGGFRAMAGGNLRVLGGLSMGTRERVVLLQVGETQLLVGVAPGRVQTLHVLEQPLKPAEAGSPVGGRFADQLGRLLKKEKPA